MCFTRKMLPQEQGQAWISDLIVCFNESKFNLSNYGVYEITKFICKAPADYKMQK